MRSLLQIIVGVLLFINLAHAQERAVFDAFTETQLKESFLIIMQGNAGSPTKDQRDVITKIITEIQSVTQHVFSKYVDNPSPELIESMWDSEIGLQKDNFKDHTYYRAIYGYYLAIYSTAPTRENQKQTWQEIDFKNRFGHAVYMLIDAPGAFQKIIQENPDYAEKITQLKDYYAYATAKDIPEQKLKDAWEHGVKRDKLTSDQNQIIQYLYTNELSRLWTMLSDEMKKAPDNRFDLFWDPTFWLQKNPKDFAEHRYYRQMICAFITNLSADQKFREGSSDFILGQGLSDFVGCKVLDTQNYYEFPWYKKLIKKMNRSLKNKKETPDEEIQDFDFKKMG